MSYLFGLSAHLEGHECILSRAVQAEEWPFCEQQRQIVVMRANLGNSTG